MIYFFLFLHSHNINRPQGAKIVRKTEGKSTSNDPHLPFAEMHTKSSLSTAYSQQIFY